MIEYLACGNVMSDIVEKDGAESQLHIGGPAMFALSGMRLWTSNCKLVTQLGADYRDTYGKWMDDNGLTHESMLVELEKTTCHKLVYDRKDGGFNYKPMADNQFMGYLKTHPYHIDAAATNDVRAIYMANNTDRVVWKKLYEVKRKYGFKIMWEVEYGYDCMKTDADDVLDRIMETAEYADMFSINHNEASHLFGIPREDDEAIIRELQKLPVELTLYRVGERGAFAVTPTEAYYCGRVDPLGDGVDPTGCGNCSTGAAAYAHAAGYGPQMTVAMANIAAGYNAAQYGPYPVYADEVMRQAKKMAHQLCSQVKKMAISN